MRPLPFAASVLTSSTAIGGDGILTVCPSTTPFGLVLGSATNPGADLPSPGNLRLSANGILTRFIVTRSGMITCTSSRDRYPFSFSSMRCNALHYRSIATTRRFGAILSPRSLSGAGLLEPVSYYAPFKVMAKLLSQHPGCHRNPTSNAFALSHGLGTLAGDLGFIPLSTMQLIPHRLAARTWYNGIRSLVSKGSRVGPLSNSVALPPIINYPNANPKVISERELTYLHV